MKILLFVLSAIVAIFVGGLNPAIELSRHVYHKDIRELGSKNPGFTNFKRVFGGKLSWVVFVLDLTKAAITVAIFAYLFTLVGVSYKLGAAYTGLFCLLGHAYPVLYGFKGGKGFLVYMSVIWFIDWRAGLIAFAILTVMLLILKFMSLATLMAVLSTVIFLAITNSAGWITTVITAVMVAFIFWRHRANIKRLIAGNENKFSFKK